MGSLFEIRFDQVAGWGSGVINPGGDYAPTGQWLGMDQIRLVGVVFAAAKVRIQIRRKNNLVVQLDKEVTMARDETTSVGG